MATLQIRDLRQSHTKSPPPQEICKNIVVLAVARHIGTSKYQTVESKRVIPAAIAALQGSPQRALHLRWIGSPAELTGLRDSCCLLDAQVVKSAA